MKKVCVQRGNNRIDVIPTVGCIIVFLYMVYILMHNMVVSMLPFGDWMDGSKAMCTLSVLVLFYMAVQYKIPYTIKKYSYFIYGYLFAMTIINSNLGTLFLALGMVCLFFVLYQGRSFWKGFVAGAVVIEMLQLYLRYNERDSMSINQTFCLSGWFVIWIVVGILAASKKTWVACKLRGKTTKNVFRTFFLVFILIFVICVAGGIIQQYFYKIPVIGSYLELPYSGHSVAEWIMSLGIKRKIACIGMTGVLYVLNVVFSIRMIKKQKRVISIFLSVFLLYSIVFADIYVPICILVCQIILFMSVKWNCKCHVYHFPQKNIIFPVVLGFVFFVMSFLITSIVDWGTNQKHPRIEITAQQLNTCDGVLVGYDVLPDGGLRSNQIDPWIVLYYGQFGIYDIQNVNVKLRYCKKDLMYIFGIGQYGRNSKYIRIGDNYMDLNFLAPGDFGIRIDLTDTYDSYFLLDKIVFNDFSYVGTMMSIEFKYIAFFLWIYVFVKQFFAVHLKIKGIKK